MRTRPTPLARATGMHKIIPFKFLQVDLHDTQVAHLLT